MNNNVIHMYGTQAEYDAIHIKDSNTLYFTIDTKRIYKGNIEIQPTDIPYIDEHDAITLTSAKAYTDEEVSKKLSLVGGTMQGDIDMSAHRIFNLSSPIDDNDAATKTYVDANASGSLADAKSYTDTKTAEVLHAAKEYTENRTKWLPI